MLPVYGRSLPVAPAVRTPQITLYPRLTRAHTPDSVRRSSHRSVSAFRRKLHYALSFFLFPRKPASLGVCEVSRAFCLDGLRHICASKAKNRTKIHRCQVQAVLPRQKGGQTTKRPQGILCVFARTLRMYGRPLCPSKPCMLLSTEGIVPVLYAVNTGITSIFGYIRGQSLAFAR